MADDRDFTRDLTRRLYLMFYVIIGIGQLIGLVGLRYGGTFHRPDVSFLIVALAGLILVRVPLYIVSRRGE